MVKVQFKGVNTYVSKGKRRYYHRKTGIRLPDDPTMPEFAAAYQRAENGLRALPGTMAALIEEYLKSADFAKLAKSTKATYRSHLDAVREVGGDLPADSMKRSDVFLMRDNLANTPRQADIRVSVLSVLFRFGVDRDYRADNPADGIKKINRYQSFEPWTAGELDTMLDQAPAHIAAVVAMALYTGQRLGDCLKVRWNDIEDGTIAVVQEKTDEPLSVPIHPDLAAVLEGLEKAPGPILRNAKGLPWTRDGFQSSFNTAKKRLGVEKAFHGLRHTAATMLADAGADDRTIAAVTGHKSASMVRKYTRRADQKKRAKAAVEMFPSRRNGNESA